MSGGPLLNISSTPYIELSLFQKLKRFMGLNIGCSKASYNDCLTPQAGNPNPANYKILKYKELGDYLILKIQYPDCKNYEGTKILIYKDVKILDLLNQKLIDPHFFEGKKFKSPMVRCEPTDTGWLAAELFCNALISRDENR